MKSAQNQTPEDRARERIDAWLRNAGWRVVNRDEYSPSYYACAVREALMNDHRHEADYLLFIKNKAVAVLEAKREEISVTAEALHDQAHGYIRRLPAQYQPVEKPIRYVSNGRELAFFDPNESPEWQPLNPQEMHSPKQIAKRVGLNGRFVGLPVFLKNKAMRDCQFEAVQNLEASFAGTPAANFQDGKKKALMVLSTGSGKTYTACLASYRLLNFAGFQRVLYIADRNNLVRQAAGEFNNFTNTENQRKLSEIYKICQLSSAGIEGDDRIVISTVQRLYSLLRGETIYDEMPDGNAEADENLADDNDAEPEIAFPPNPKLPPDFFDLIFIDECHRSIYNEKSWGAVIKYFKDAWIVGLTATADEQTRDYFDGNVVINYDHERAVRDGVNVPKEIYTIQTKISNEGVKIEKGETYQIETPLGIFIDQVAQEDLVFPPQSINQVLEVRSQIKVILEHYRDAVYTKLFPNRAPEIKFLPKTLIFAKNDRHAQKIVEVAKEVFGVPAGDEHFVQRITCAAGDSINRISNFNNSKDFRIAVTVTLVSTGTDIRPLEVVMFLRDVNSDKLFQQMWGRGVRTISDDKLREVTPNADSKEHFFIVDAVGATEHHRTAGTAFTAAGTQLSFRAAVEKLSHEEYSDEAIHRFARGLVSFKYRKMIPTSLHEKFSKLTGTEIVSFGQSLLECFDAEQHLKSPAFPPFVRGQHNLERANLVAPIIGVPAAKALIFEMWEYRYGATSAPDEIILADFSHDRAKENVAAFEAYIHDEYNAENSRSRKICDGPARELNYDYLADFRDELCSRNFVPAALWNSYKLLDEENKVFPIEYASRDNVTNIIPLVQFALKRVPALQTLASRSAQLFNLWCGQKQRIVPATGTLRELYQQFARKYLIVNGFFETNDLLENNTTLHSQLLQRLCDPQTLAAELQSLAEFLLLPNSKIEN